MPDDTTTVIYTPPESRFDFTRFYIPDPTQLDPEMVVDARNRLVLWIGRRHPDLDTRPNSVFGDLFVTPAAEAMAAMEEGLRRVRWDLDLSNAANGQAYDCEFVSRIIRNLTAKWEDGRNSFGVVRLTLVENEDVELDRGTRWSAGEDSIFRLKLQKPGPLIIHAAGTQADQLNPDENNVILRETESGVWTVDVALEGWMPPDFVIDEDSQILLDDEQVAANVLSDAVVLYPFYSAGMALSVAEAARLTRVTVHAPNLVTPWGVKALLKKELPGLSHVTVVSPGDAEMMRAAFHPLGLAVPRFDIYVGHGYYESLPFVEELLVADYDTENQKFYVELTPPLGAYRMSSLVAVEGPDTNLRSTAIIFAQSEIETEAPMFSAAGSGHEKFWAVWDMPLGDEDEELITTDVITGGRTVGLFRVVYSMEPYHESAKSIAEEFGRSVVKTMPFLLISELRVGYRRRKGTSVALKSAAEEIRKIVLESGPDKPLSKILIADAMFLAGASDVVSVSCISRMHYGLADAHLPVGTAEPTEDFHDAADLAESPDAYTTEDFDELFPTLTDEDTFAAAGPNNLRYMFEDPITSLVFEEIL